MIIAQHIHELISSTFPGLRWGIHKFEQKARFHEKHAILGILIRDLHWGLGDPYTWSGKFENSRISSFPGHKSKSKNHYIRVRVLSNL